MAPPLSLREHDHLMPPVSFSRLPRRKLLGVLLLASAAGLLVYIVFFRGPSLTRELEWSSQSQDAGPLYASDCKTLVTGGEDPIRLWNASTGALNAALTNYEAHAYNLAVSPKGDFLACTRLHRARKQPDRLTLELWDLGSGKRLVEIEDYTTSVTFSPSGAALATVTLIKPNSTAPTAIVHLRSIPTLAPTASIPIPNPGASLCFSPDGKSLAIGHGFAIELFDLKTLRSIATFKGAPFTRFGPIAFYPDGKTLAAIASVQSPQTGGLCTWDVATAQVKVNVDFGHDARGASFSADGHTVAVHLLWYMFSRSDRIEVWDTTTGSRMCSLTDRRRYFDSIALSPDAAHLAIAYQSKGPKVPAPLTIWRID